MTPKRFYFVMIGLFSLGVIGIGATMYLGNQILQKSSVSLVNAKLSNQVSEEQERSYIQAKKDLVKYKELGDTIAKVLPKNKDQAQAVSELYRIGDETGITITAIRFPTSTLGQKAAPAAASTTPSSSTTPKVTQPTVSQSKNVEGIQNVYGIDVDLELSSAKSKTVSYAQMLSFLDKIQQNRRSMQITKVTVTPDIKNGGVTFNLSVRIFVKQ